MKIYSGFERRITECWSFARIIICDDGIINEKHLTLSRRQFVVAFD